MPDKNDVALFVFYAIAIGALMFAFSLFSRGIDPVNEVRINATIAEEINSMFLASQQTGSTFVLCLRGNIKEGIANINSYQQSEFLEVVDDEHSKVTCKRGTIGTIHNHNNEVCKLSYRDAYTFGLSKHSFIGIICVDEDFRFYSPEDLVASVGVIIN